MTRGREHDSNSNRQEQQKQQQVEKVVASMCGRMDVRTAATALAADSIEGQAVNTDGATASKRAMLKDAQIRLWTL
jgi:hypothetical protein